MSSTAISPEAIIRELIRLGFRKYDASGRAGVTWAHPQNEEGVAVLVPRAEDRGLVGYQETIESAIQRLSWLTEEPIEQVRRRLSSPDQVELRIVHDLTRRNSLRLLDTPRVVTGFVNLIKNGARTAFSGARAIHHGSGGADYQEAVRSIEVLAPAPGSFKLVAVSAEEPQLGLGVSAPPTPTKSRTALATTMDTVRALAAAPTSAAGLSDDDVLELVDAGVSQQLLNAVKTLAIGETAGLSLEFRGTFDPLPGLTSASGEPVTLGDSHVSLAHKLRERLSTYAPMKDYRLIGWAETTSAADHSLEGFPKGTIIVRQKAGRPTLVLVELDSKTFPLVQAGVSEVRMLGTLERIAGRWHLLDPHAVEIHRPRRE